MVITLFGLIFDSLIQNHYIYIHESLHYVVVIWFCYQQSKEINSLTANSLYFCDEAKMTQKPVGHEKGKGLGYGLSEIPMCEGRRLGTLGGGVLGCFGHVGLFGVMVIYTMSALHLLLGTYSYLMTL